MADLETPPVNGLPLTKEGVGADFAPAPKEVELVAMLNKLVSDAEPLIVGKSIADEFATKLTAGHWTKLKEILKAQVRDVGAVGMARKIASCPTDVPEMTLKDLEYCVCVSTAKESKTFTYTWQQIAGRLLALRKQAWALQASNIKAVEHMERVLKAYDTPKDTTGLDFQVDDLKREVGLVLGEVKSQGMASPKFNELIAVEKPLPGPLSLDNIAILKKMLWLLLKDKPTLLKEKKPEDYSMDDIVFQCERKPGPLKKTGELPDDRVITFAVEVCADHSQNRLKSCAAPSSGAKPEVDIQLVPSAGMIMVSFSIDSRVNGFTVNCDGWNASSALLASAAKLGRAVNAITIENGEWPPMLA